MWDMIKMKMFRVSDFYPAGRKAHFIKMLYYYNSIVGKIGITENEGAITNVFFENTPFDVKGYNIYETPLIKEAIHQLREYESGARKVFYLPLNPQGTVFQNKVWKALLQIPYGETRNYKEIAALVGSPAACRAVGQANHKNPIPIFIPCHRVIGASGKLTGYAGGLDRKAKLLQLEQQF